LYYPKMTIKTKREKKSPFNWLITIDKDINCRNLFFLEISRREM
jgi:hypothetical protein